MSNIDEDPLPTGNLELRTIAAAVHTNGSGDIFGGWLVSQMDLAGNAAATKVAKGRVATVAIDKMGFMVPVALGAAISCYCEVQNVGRSSVSINIEVWNTPLHSDQMIKVTEGLFIFVAIDDNGRTRRIPK